MVCEGAKVTTVPLPPERGGARLRTDKASADRVAELEEAIGVMVPTIIRSFLAMIPEGAAHNVDREAAQNTLARVERAMSSAEPRSAKAHTFNETELREILKEYRSDLLSRGGIGCREELPAAVKTASLVARISALLELPQQCVKPLVCDQNEDNNILPKLKRGITLDDGTFITTTEIDELRRKVVGINEITAENTSKEAAIADATSDALELFLKKVKAIANAVAQVENEHYKKE